MQAANLGVAGSSLPVNLVDSGQLDVSQHPVNIEQAEFQMQQEMKNLLQNSSAVAQFTHGEFEQR